MKESLLETYINEVITNELKIRDTRNSFGTRIANKISSFLSGRFMPGGGPQPDMEFLNASLNDWFEEIEMSYNGSLSYGKKREMQKIAQKIYMTLLKDEVDSRAAVQKTMRIMNRKYAQSFE